MLVGYFNFTNKIIKSSRLYDSHKRVQKLNQVLEDKLLQMVDKMKSEKSQLTKDIATLSVRLAESKHNYSMLQKENVSFYMLETSVNHKTFFY